MSETNRWDGFSDEELRAMVRSLPLASPSDVELALWHDASQELDRRRRPALCAAGQVQVVRIGQGWVRLKTWNGQELELSEGDVLTVPALVIS